MKLPFPGQACPHSATDMPWWQKAVFYQIYPRSFQDGNGDGIGDLEGIRRRLDYIESLGIGAVWLSPVYPSPMHDFGYDVADYCDIHPVFGSLDDFDHLLEDLHRRGIRLVMDLIPAHSSHEHPWFMESRSSRSNPKRDWYIWRDARPDGTLPNNWLSAFGGPAWTLDETTGQYYMHTFLSQQPDLNYHNPEVVAAMEDVMRFWLSRGVDGFRVDVASRIVKDRTLRDAGPNPLWDKLPPRLRTPFYALDPSPATHRPENHALLRRFRSVLDEFADRVMIGETHGTYEELNAYFGEGDEIHLPFNFHLVLEADWSARRIRKLVDGYDASIPEGRWPNHVLGNHDQHRLATRVGPQQARVATMLLLTLRGTPTCYYGDELGIENVVIPPEKVCDPPALRMPERAHIVGRDPARTPMQWDDSPNAGFCPAGVEPWLPIEEAWPMRNRAVQERDPRSLLSLFRALITLRQSQSALHAGAYTSIDTNQPDVFAFRRDLQGTPGFLVLLNFGASTRRLRTGCAKTQVALSTAMDRAGESPGEEVELLPNEGLLLRVME
jgi:alpha-glucosidase